MPDQRELVTQRVLSTIHRNSLLLMGSSQSRRTDTLLQLKQKLADTDQPGHSFYPIYIDLREVRECDLFQRVSDAVHEHFGFARPERGRGTGRPYTHRDLAADFRRIIVRLRSHDKDAARLVLLVDGIDRLNTFSPRTTQRVRSLFMAGLAENLVMVATAQEIDHHWEQESSPWYNFFEELELGPVDPAGSDRDRMPRDGPG
jgi:hypothetical protein